MNREMASSVLSIAREKMQQLPRRSALPAILTVAMAIVSLVGLLLLVQTSGVTTTGYDVRRLEQEREDWQQANYQIEAEIAYRQSLSRVEKEARDRLKMAPATEYVFVRVAETPYSSPDSLSPPSRWSNARREEDGWSQHLLDWLGSVLGFRER